MALRGKTIIPIRSTFFKKNRLMTRIIKKTKAEPIPLERKEITMEYKYEKCLLKELSRFIALKSCEDISFEVSKISADKESPNITNIIGDITVFSKAQNSVYIYSFCIRQDETDPTKTFPDCKLELIDGMNIF